MNVNASKTLHIYPVDISYFQKHFYQLLLLSFHRFKLIFILLYYSTMLFILSHALVEHFTYTVTLSQTNCYMNHCITLRTLYAYRFTQ
jgi:hypothetical protein